MANVVIVGMQWGDEGKGKIVDILCPAFDVVARFQGGHNAGHTVKFGDEHFALHLIPSGILREDALCVLGNGMVIDPGAFFDEVSKLEAAEVSVTGRLHVSRRAHLVLPAHAALDQAREAARGERKIGTTSRGIGPTYESKAARYGLRLCDLDARDLETRLRELLGRIEGELAHLGAEKLGHIGHTLDLCRDWRQRFAPYLHDTELLLNRWIDEGRPVLFEGAQGTFLDVDHGTYPYVTSSNSTAGGACTGTGVPPTRIDGVLGVLKAYTTRVGEGPFPTEIEGARGDYLRRRGNEFGTTTQRPRRCGWLDVVAARHSRRLNGVSAIALTKLDILDPLEKIPVCIGYRYRGTLYKEYGTDFQGGDKPFQPVYKTMKGWRKETGGILDYDDLPPEARDYIDLIEQEVGAPVALVSTGPRREETAIRPLPILQSLTGGRLGG